VLFGVPGGILGMVSPTLGGIVGGTGRVLSGLTLSPYSREQELEADRVGGALAARAGWDPKALAELLGTLERAESAAGGAPKRSSFFATHPSTPDRVANIETVARSVSPAAVAPIAGSRAALLGRLEGLVVGDNAADGVFADRLFLHPDFDVALEMPGGWKTANTPEAAGAVAPEKAAAVLLQVAGTGDDPVAAARAGGLNEELLKGIRRFSIAGLPAAAIAAATRDGTRVLLTWIAHRSRVFRVTAFLRAIARQASEQRCAWNEPVNGMPHSLQWRSRTSFVSTKVRRPILFLGNGSAGACRSRCSHN